MLVVVAAISGTPPETRLQQRICDHPAQAKDRQREAVEEEKGQKLAK